MDYLLELSPSDEENRIAVRAAAGASDEDIAAELQLSLEDLQGRYGRVIEKHRAAARNDMLLQFHKAAKSASNHAAALFWVKSQCGWRDTGSSAENAGVFQPVVKVVRMSHPDEPDARN